MRFVERMSRKKEKKYLLMPGWIISKTDGDRHFISALELARLYEVSMDECVVWPEQRHEGSGFLLASQKGLKVLEPLWDGDYPTFRKREVLPTIRKIRE